MNIDAQAIIDGALAAGSRALDATKNLIAAAGRAAQADTVKIEHARAGRLSKTEVSYGVNQSIDGRALQIAQKQVQGKIDALEQQLAEAGDKIADLESALLVMTQAPGAPDHSNIENEEGDLHAWLDNHGAPDLSTLRDRVQAWAVTQHKAADDLISAMRRERDSALDQNRALHDQVVEYKSKAERDMVAMKAQVMIELASRFEQIHDEQVSEIEGLGKALDAHQETAYWIESMRQRLAAVTGVLCATDPVLEQLGRVAQKFDGFDIQFRKYGNTWPNNFRFRIITNDNALAEYRGVDYGATLAEALRALDAAAQAAR